MQLHKNIARRSKNVNSIDEGVKRVAIQLLCEYSTLQHLEASRKFRI